MIERCQRICGGLDSCFINSKKHIECLSDILINKAFGTAEILEQLIKECQDKRLVSFLREALRASNEIINWAKYLQIAHDLKVSLKSTHSKSTEERRREIRYPMPEVLQRYISLTINADGRMLEGMITNMSQQGLQLITDEPLRRGMIYDLRISSLRATGKELFLKIKVVYSYSRKSCDFLETPIKKQDEIFISGAMVVESSDELSFNFFRNVLELIYYL